MDLFKGRYRIVSNRKPGRNYALPGLYFVTICTKGMDCWFGEIRSGMMGLNEIGCVVADEIQRTPSVRPSVTIDDWIVMPNHVHMIIAINAQDDATNANPVETHRRCVSTWVDACMPAFRRRPGTLGSIIAQIKSLCTKRIRAMGYMDFAWQSNYFDRIIRSDAMLRNIRNYIAMNPWRWAQNRNNPDGCLMA